MTDTPEPPANAPVPSAERTRPARRRIRAALRALGVVLVALIGGGLGWFLAPASTMTVGPLELSVTVRPSLNPEAVVEMPPFGTVSFDTHRGPIAIVATVQNVDVDAAQQLIGSDNALAELEEQVPDSARNAVLIASAWGVLFALAGAALAAVLVYRSKRRVIASTLVAAVTVAGMGGLSLGTFTTESMSQPTFTGLLSRAPYIAQQGIGVLNAFETYRQGLAQLVKNVASLYATTENLPSLPKESNVVTALHVSDIHLNPIAADVINELVPQLGVDVVIDTGDIVSWGTSFEASTLDWIGRVPAPYVFVAGNHDSRTVVSAIEAQPNAVVLNDTVATVAGLTIAGIPDPRYMADDAAGTAGEKVIGNAAVRASNQHLAETIDDYDAAHPTEPVQIAAIHDPKEAKPLFGHAPIVVAGHLHKRSVTVEADGTYLMVEGSTGAGGPLQPQGDGSDGFTPLDINATLLYIASSGERAGQLVAYDEITIGGLGLASVSIKRTVVRADDESEPSPSESTGTEPGATESNPTGTEPSGPASPDPAVPGPAGQAPTAPGDLSPGTPDTSGP